jgi:hypothetical protein
MCCAMVAQNSGSNNTKPPFPIHATYNFIEFSLALPEETKAYLSLAERGTRRALLLAL